MGWRAEDEENIFKVITDICKIDVNAVIYNKKIRYAKLVWVEEGKHKWQNPGNHYQ